MKSIRLRGARQNNLRGIDLDIPHGQWVAVVGPSGSGKSSLAVQTLYAEGQRRYVESFSPYTRQFLDQVQKPAADSIAGVPPAVVVSAVPTRFGRRTTAGSWTGIVELLRVLYGRLADVFCPGCGVEVRADEPGSIATELEQLPAGTRFMTGFRVADWWQPLRDAVEAGGKKGRRSQAGQVPGPGKIGELLRQTGLRRIVMEGQTGELTPELDGRLEKLWPEAFVVTDRLMVGRSELSRVRDSLEQAMGWGGGRCATWVEGAVEGWSGAGRVRLDERDWTLRLWSRNADCPGCGQRLRRPEPAMFSNTSPLGACPACEGFGEIPRISRELVIPDPGKSLREGAIAPWNTESYRECLHDLLRAAPVMGVPVDAPFAELTAEQVAKVFRGDKAAGWDGVDGFFRWLERKKYRLHHRVFLSRWRKWEPCSECGGRQLNAAALACRLWDRDLASLLAMPVEGLLETCRIEGLAEGKRPIARPLLEPIRERLAFLAESGLGGVALARPLATLSTGQVQRVVLAAVLGTSLVRMLYVLDEPVTGLHPADIERIVPALRRLHGRPNTLLVADHSPELITAADRVVELGPGSGTSGGSVVFDGTPDELVGSRESPTGLHLAGEKGHSHSADRRRCPRGELVLRGAAGRNLRGIDVRFPLGVLCAVTGVSGAGKSTLVRDTLLPLVASSLGRDEGTALPHGGLTGTDQVEEVVWMDAAPPPRSSRSVPATWIGIWDSVRKLFAETAEARAGNLKAGSFSFNVAGGRCDKCEGTGRLEIDMQFLADVSMVCDECRGQRFRPLVLGARYRGKNVAEVLDMTAAEAFGHFRGHPEIQAGLKALKDAGLDYLRLGQPLDTLSRGETQRLKLASSLAGNRRRRTLFLLDSPAAGLHMDDITRLVDCLAALIDVGHSVIIMEHVTQLLAHADWIIDLGPGADQAGGNIVAAGTPEAVAACVDSATGACLARYLARGAPGGDSRTRKAGRKRKQA